MQSSFVTFVGAAVFAAVSLISTQLLAGGGADYPPFIAEPSPCDQEIFITPGETLTFPVTAAAAGGYLVVLSWNHVPFSANMSPPPLIYGNPSATSQFTYTPGPSDAGQSYIATFVAYLALEYAEPAICDIYITVENSLSADVTDFSAKAGGIGGPVKVHWETSSEIDNAYFNIFRSESTLDKAIQINAAPIMAKGGPAIPATYNLGDRRVASGHIYNYWIETVDIYGATQILGPTSVNVR